jgi:Transglycosylase SLT domain
MGIGPGVRLTPIPPTPDPKEVDDALAKDEKVPIRTLVRDAGWTGAAVYDAVGVIGAESSFNPEAYNDTPCSQNGDHAVGLLQICTVHSGKFGIPSGKAAAVEWLKDPQNNLSAGYKLWLSAGRTFKNDWVQAQNGAYRKFRMQNPLITAKKKRLTGVVGDAVDSALGPVDEFMGALLSPSTWFRVGKGMLGGNLILLGGGALAFVVAKKVYNNPAVKSTVKVASKGTPVGKAVGKVVK